MHDKRPNKFAGECYRCGGTVAAEAGYFSFEGSPGLRWPAGRFQRNWPLVEHKDCADLYAGTNVHHVFQPAEKQSECEHDFTGSVTTRDLLGSVTYRVCGLCAIRVPT